MQDKRIDNYLEYFQIEEQYKYHKKQAEDIVIKSKIYTDEYIDELWDSKSSLFEEMFKSKDNLKQSLIGYVADQANINDEILSKFKRDIGIQVGLIKGNKLNNIYQKRFKGIETGLIDTLKVKLNRLESMKKEL